MKTLLIMRHGKSSWKDEHLDDHERPLAKRGVRESRMMGELLRDRELIPEMILLSTSERTRQTAQLLKETSGFEGEMRALDSLYLAEAETYIQALLTLPDDIERVMVIGHNPGLEALLQILSGRIEALPTAVVAYISLPIDHWTDLTNKVEGELVELWRPKELRELEEEAEEKKEKEKEKEKEREKEKEKRKEKPQKGHKKK